MFREMRLKDQQLSAADSRQILKTADYGTLALLDADYPYATPISYVYDPDQDKIYLHGAPTGQRHDLLTRNSAVVFSVVGGHQILAHQYTMAYRSVLVYGHIQALTNPAAIQHAMELVSEKYAPGLLAGGRKYIASAKGQFEAYALTIDHLTGKRSTEPLTNN
ncbi:pyridoxamine 5'-phosphate oxidase family protein [Levilactobacillus zymae]|uniref:pyridoxamine 5'-phosphate oxidase family protein n=1 Tax=Levilactobacillus zymae TaxID=267363 RepID=UPI0028B781A5|nr:pyridoxamine 5'-phosphate oxidase family protein [Levilactobacillus zymae]MDT6979292.1 pyridoxamine 5'-phosphate oxidase family protein [Levilactobacillus zymae]